MKNIKMIVTDLDGTLLRTDKTISNYTASVFQQCIAEKIKVICATARPIRAVKMLNLPFQLDAMICHNGAIVQSGDIATPHYGISSHVAMDIVTAALKNDSTMRICIEMNDSIYSNADPSDIWPGIETNLTDFSNLPTMPADKIILLTADTVKLDAIQKVLPEDLYLEVSENTIGMILHRAATKRNALRNLSDAYAIAFDEIAAFGDDHNDIELLESVGAGVAVGNAIDEVKAAANYHCDTNDNDGVAKWIDKNVLYA